MNYGLTYNWRKPSIEEIKRIKKMDRKRYFNRIKNFFFFLSLIVILVYLATFASLSYRDNKLTENILTLLILTIIVLASIIIFLVVYKLLYRHFYGVKMDIEEVNDRVTFLYHHMVGGVNDTEKLYAIVLKVDNEQIELLVDQKDYETINEDTKLLLGRYHDGAQYNYYVYY